MKVSLLCLTNLNKNQFLLTEDLLIENLSQALWGVKKKLNRLKNTITIALVIIILARKKVSTTQFQDQVQRLLH